MFDRFIRLARAKKALQEGRLEDAARLADDPLIRGDRRAEQVRQRAQAELLRRGRQRLDGGDANGAVRDLERAVAVAADSTAVGDLARARELQEATRVARQRDLAVVEQARRAAERGELAAASQLLQDLDDRSPAAAAAAAARAFVAARRTQAQEQWEQARRCHGDGAVAAAIAGVARAQALCVDPAAAPSWLPQLLQAGGKDLAAALRADLGRGDAGAAIGTWRRRLGELPALGQDAAAAAAAAELAAVLLRRLADVATEQDAELLQRCAAEPILPGPGVRVAAAARLRQRLPALRAGGRVGELAAALDELAEQLGDRTVAGEARDLRQRDQAVQVELARARELAAAGDLQGARAVLAAVLQEQPMHEETRRELDAIDDGAREREHRLESARQAAKDGRLRAAYALALAWAQAGPAGDEARVFAQGLRARMDLVGRGLDQVRGALHGKTSGGIAGLRHCLLRLDELAKVQQDHDELPPLRAAIEVELDGLERLEQASAAVAAAQFQSVAAVIGDLVQRRQQLLSSDRLDARILELVDQVAVAAERALATGRLDAADRCVPALAAAAVVRPELAQRAERLRLAVQERRARAEALANEAAGLLAQRDLSAAEQRSEAARQLWVDGASTNKIEAELQALRQQEAVLERAAALVEGGDVDGAHDELGALPPTPALLRTRIFDMKQSLARAQGLDGPFLLRVDEGGEFVAVRGESVTIGNLRDGSADLPVLAAIAGRHARIERRMSFHGGMEDAVVADGGEVRASGARVARHRLRSGDRVQLGAALQVGYRLPSKRSLTAVLQLFGGFQVAGTDRVLLFKDRGRDGRILIGPGADVHVRVPGATGEIEVYAHKSGPMRVRCDGGGEIDGQPFRGEHPVAAGATVRAAGISFVLLPWSPAR